MSLLVVCPFFYGDVHLLLKNLAWMKELDGTLDYRCLLACDHLTDPDPARREASTLFREVDVFRYQAVPNRAWPWPQNNAFTSVSWHVAGKHKGPWIWVETDSIPLCKGWLDALWTDYQKGGKPFGGHWNHATNVFNGVAIYPQQVAQYSDKMMMANMLDVKDASGQLHQPPWDAYGSKQVRPHLHEMNHLMQHIWHDDATGEAWTFPDRATVERVIRPGVVLFHRCKNESLMARLREANNVNIQKAETADVVSLRRNGDIISLLPLLKRMADNLDRPVRLAVMREYAPLLEGVSYVEAVPWDGDMEDPLPAASRLNAVNAQVFGRGMRTNTREGNFVKKAWSLLGFRWDRYAPLVFDRRYLAREEILAKSTFRTGKPKILVKMHGHSSPLTDAAVIWNALKAEFSEVAELVNLDDVKANRIYDMLGLMDRAACCVTIDTVAIHLAPSTPCPMVQIVHDTEFGASPAKGNCLLRIHYAQVRQRIPAIIGMVRKCLEPKSAGDGIVLVHGSHAAGGEREDRARATWPKLGARLLSFSPQRSSAGIGDKRAMPFVRDMIHAAFTTGSEPIMAVCNNDVQIGDELRAAIVDSCAIHECYWAYRTPSPGGKPDGGADLFAFTRRWWHLHEHLIPDLFHGYRWWDQILIRLMLWSGCREQAREYYHEPHGNDHRMRLNTPGAQWNERLAAQWLDMHDDKDQRP